MQGKVASGQTTRVVLNVTGTNIDIAALKTQFQNGRSTVLKKWSP